MSSTGYDDYLYQYGRPVQPKDYVSESINLVNSQGYSEDEVASFNFVSSDEYQGTGVGYEFSQFFLGTMDLDDIGLAKRAADLVFDSAISGKIGVVLDLISIGRDVNSMKDTFKNSNISFKAKDIGYRYINYIFLMDPNEADKYFYVFNYYVNEGRKQSIKNHSLEEACVLMSEAVAWKPNTGYDSLVLRTGLDIVAEVSGEAVKLSLNVVSVLLTL